MSDIKLSHTITKELQRAVADLQHVDPRLGLWRFGCLGGLCLGWVAIAWHTPNLWMFLFGTVIAGFCYAFWLVCTHDAVHQTLTGWRWFDTIGPRLVSYPMLWPHGLYAELHRLHHGWNGIDLRDPERVQWTQQEYEQAHPIVRWYVRHQWAIDIVLWGGAGMILKTTLKAWKFRHLVPRIYRQLCIDFGGILLMQGILVTIAIRQGQGFRYLLFWLVLERVIGAIVQTRDHLEHYALWGNASGYQLTQLYTCRNLKTHRLVNWLMGGLPYHAIHHAFPSIPFNQLALAFERVQTVLQNQGLPAIGVGQGYVKETLHFAQHPSLIGDPNPTDPSGRHHMICL